MFDVHDPRAFNETFARAFNSRNIENLARLYEENAAHGGAPDGAIDVGPVAIRRALEKLLAAPGVMESRNNFCIQNGEIALLRADWTIRDGGQVIAAGSSAEIARRQADGRWLYVIDHAFGASRPNG